MTRTKTHVSRLCDDSGSAVLMAVLVLFALVAVMAPFAISMSLEQREALAQMYQTQARLIAEGSVQHAIAAAYRTQDVAERKGTYGSPFDTPDYDTRSEMWVDFEFTDPMSRGVRAKLKEMKINFTDPKGRIWHARLTGEQGKVNILSAPPLLVGNLLGSSTLTDTIGSSDTVLPLADTTLFWIDPEAKPPRGYVILGANDLAELISVDDDSITVRRIGRGDDEPPTGHGRGTVVYDARGLYIASYKFQARRGLGELAPLRSIYEARNIVKTAGGGVMLEPELFERIERDITIDSYREAGAGWVRREPVIQTGNLNPDSDTLRIRDGSNYGRGTFVRITGLEGKVQTYKRVWRTFKRGKTRNLPEHYVVRFESPVGLSGEGTDYAIEAEQRHSININTASYRVLQAVFTGVGLWRGAPVGGAQAKLLADFIVKRVQGGQAIAGEDEFKEMLADFNTFISTQYDDYALRKHHKDALIFNATDPNSIELRGSTTTFCYKSYGNFTIEASGVVNSPAGTERARHTARQIVSVPSASPGFVVIRSQVDFTEYVLGRKVTTAPQPLFDNNYSPDDSIKDNVGDARLEAAETADPRRNGGFIKHFRQRRGNDPFELTVEGGEMQGFFTWGSNAVFGRVSAPLPRQGYRTMAPGFFEMWVKPRGGVGQYYFFDAGNQDNRNRVAFYYDRRNRELILEVWDANLYGESAQLRFPYTLDANTWYNVAASWKGTDYGQLAIRVDDHVFGEGGVPAEYSPGGRLSTALTMDMSEDAVDLEAGADLSGFPDQGAIIVDGEVIEYQIKTNSGFEQCRRAARWTPLEPHAADTTVRPFGYVNRLSGNNAHNYGPNRLAPTRGFVASDLGTNPRTRIDAPGDPAAGTPAGIDDVVTIIPVLDTAQFQDKGVIRIDNEFIFYRRKTPTSFEGCQRGYIPPNSLGRAAPHNHNRSITLYSLAITDSSGLNNPNNNGQYPIVSLETSGETPEWVQYGKIDNYEGGNYLLPRIRRIQRRGREWWEISPSPRRPLRLPMRGAFGTAVTDHDGGNAVRVLPVVSLDWPWCGEEASPAAGSAAPRISLLSGDGVAGGRRERARISRAYARQKPIYVWRGSGANRQRFLVNTEDINLISLRRTVRNTYHRGNTGRVHKFPSGELPTQIPRNVNVCADRAGGGQFVGVADEIKFVKSKALTGRLLQPLAANANQIVMEIIGAGGAPPQRGGVIRIDDEYIYYTLALRLSGGSRPTIRWSPGPPEYARKRFPENPQRRDAYRFTTSTEKRGILDTRPVQHSRGAPVMLYDSLPVTILDGPLPSKSEFASLHDASMFDPDGGYVRIGREAIGYTHVSGNNLDGIVDFRGAFGTGEAGHASGYVVQGIPFRFYDRYAKEVDNAELAFFQASHTARDAVWKTLEWEARDTEGTGPSSAIRIVTLVRFDGKPAWTEPPSNQEGGIWRFTGGGPYHFQGLGRMPGVKADQIEVRMFFEYGNNAYQYSASDHGSVSQLWKSNAAIDTVIIEYFNPLVVRRHDIVDK